MSKNKHTFAKRQREIEKKRKADEKRAKRRDKTEPGYESDAETAEGDTPEDGHQSNDDVTQAASISPSISPSASG